MRRFVIKRIEQFTARDCKADVSRIVWNIPDEFCKESREFQENFISTDDLHLAFIRWADGKYEGYCCPMVDGKPEYETLLCEFTLDEVYLWSRNQLRESQVSPPQEESLSDLLMRSKTLSAIPEKADHFGWAEAVLLATAFVVIILGAVVLR